MKLQINGDFIDVPETVKVVSDVLQYFQLDSKVVIVELNREILEKSHHSEIPISDGDKIEIVHFVGGG
ncbi:thiamine biosynthesis protein ThiS [Heyndrickxia shackletonii]|uniref:Thiamine biosynthesis protein ThiS n=1 Tax=Heyndrickxia shackletonii TaxID=157838 RepID=A0A0Q3WYG7_9BACI|nr:sulfur carrier protein ThiS [Heyndrickxia shackletonii]KQL54227.1 thiamine biosynthesis protein ThiS [Heyndrickxia shackletonii]MBB2482113.1 thiamine biosynthesis protein ThiS [Bacillus sp. APMAM]NEZ00906.1 thiamine biosynthesis protein ThiS [Heyndrickxia shackletonii]RTZ54544.1 thiamine biosynthesis protein ThiS [Bacillus sp. SAJ1]